MIFIYIIHVLLFFSKSVICFNPSNLPAILSVPSHIAKQFTYIPANLWNRFTNLEPEATMSALDLIRHNGFPAENYTVTTRDGFVLDVYRIPGGRKGKADPAKLPLLLVHGTKDDANIWLLNLQNQSLAYVAADNGFDVWLANCRCSRDSCRHKTLNPNSPAFWNWSWDEIATYDLPVIIDLVLKITGHKQLYYTGHSLGVLVGFALLSTQPEYNSKIKAIFSLASQGNFADADIFLRTGSSFEFLIKIVTKLLRIYEIGWPRIFPRKLMAYIGKWFPTLVELFLFSGPSKNINVTRIPVYEGQARGSTSFMVYLHDAQTMEEHRIQKYDLGEKTNMAKYGSPTPPKYDLSKVKAATCLYYGTKDKTVGGLENAQYLKKELGNVTKMNAVKDYTHHDFVFSMDAVTAIYDKIIQEMNKNSK